jgi:hypothetical protein
VIVEKIIAAGRFFDDEHDAEKKESLV